MTAAELLTQFKDPVAMASMSRARKAQMREQYFEQTILEDAGASDYLANETDNDEATKFLQGAQGIVYREVDELLIPPKTTPVPRSQLGGMANTWTDTRQDTVDLRIPLQSLDTETTMAGLSKATEQDLKDISDEELNRLGNYQIQGNSATAGKRLLRLIDPKAWQRLSDEAKTRSGVPSLMQLTAEAATPWGKTEFVTGERSDTLKGLISLAHPSTGFTDPAIAVGSLVAGGVGAVKGATKLGLKGIPKIAALMAAEGTTAVAYSKTAPGLLAELAGKPDSHLLNFGEAAALAGVGSGIQAIRALKGQPKRRIQHLLREVYQAETEVDFSKGAFAWIKHQVTPQGHFPTLKVANLKHGMNAAVAAETNRALYTVKQLKKAIKEEHPGQLNQPAFRYRVNDALQTRAGLGSFSPKTANAIKRARKQRIRLSRAARDLPGTSISTELKQVIDHNEYTYLTRAYRMFEEADYAKKFLKSAKKQGSEAEQIVNEAKRYIRNSEEKALLKDLNETLGLKLTKLDNLSPRAAELLDSRLTIKVGNLLDTKGKDMLGHLSTTFGRDMGVTRKRKEIPIEVRKLWGEYKDPFVNYQNTVGRVAQFVETSQFFERVTAQGLRGRGPAGKGRFLSVKGDPDAGLTAQIPDNPRYGAMKNLYTTPEFQKVFENMDELDIVTNKGLNLFMRMFNMANKNLTVFNPTTQVRNVVGGWWMQKVAGRLNPVIGAKATKSMMAGLKNPAQVDEWAKAGLLGDSVEMRQIQELGQDIRGGAALPDMPDRLATKILTSPATAATKAFTGADDLNKVYAYEFERIRYADKLGEAAANSPQVKEWISKIVANTYPSYSRVGKAQKLARRLPVTNFMSFTSESIRTFANIPKLALQEMSVPELRAIGAERMAGWLGMGVLGVPILKGTVEHLAGTSHEESVAGHRFTPEFQQSHPTITIKDAKDPDKLNTIDMSQYFPFSVYTEPVQVAMMMGENPDVSPGSLAKLVQGYFDMKVPLTAGIAVKSNTSNPRTKANIVNPEADFQTQMAKKAQFLADKGGMLPKFIFSANKLRKAVVGEKGRFGREYSVETELASLLLGFKLMRQSMDERMYHMGQATQRNYNLTTELFTGPLREHGANLTPRDHMNMLIGANKAKFKTAQSTYADIQAARDLGKTDLQIKKALKRSKLGDREASMLMQGRFMPYRPNAETYKKARENGVNLDVSAINGYASALWQSGLLLDPKVKFPH